MNIPVFLNGLRRLDATWASAGHPAFSAFWWATVESFMRSKRKTLVVRAGRRSGKSLTSCKLAVAFALLGGWKIRPGDQAAIVIVSVSLAEAQSKLRLIRSLLDALRIAPTRETTSEIELSNGIVFRCMAANMRTGVGFGSVLIIGDEVTRMRDDSTGKNPAKEIFASMKPSLATYPGSRVLLVSAPLGRGDYHAKQFDRGDTADQQVAYAPSWIGNPTLTEAGTRLEEPDPRIWAREYKAEPQSSALGAFEVDDIARMTRPFKVLRRFKRFVFIDANSGKSDDFVAAVGGYDETEPEGRVLTFDRFERYTAEQVRQSGIEAILDRILEMAEESDAETVVGDQRESMALGAAFRRRGLRFVEQVWSAPSKMRATQHLRRLLLEGRFSAPLVATQLAQDALDFEEVIDPNSGQLTFRGHCGDHLAAVLTACMFDLDKRLRGSDVTRGKAASRDRPIVSGTVYEMRKALDAPDDNVFDRIQVQGGAVVVRPRARSRVTMRGGLGGGGF
jgi:hypothetical protein